MKLPILIAAVLLIVFCAVGITSARDFQRSNKELKVKGVQLQTTSDKLHQLNVKHQKLNIQLKAELSQKQVNEAKVKQLEQEKKALEEKTRQLEARKRERSRLALFTKASAQTPHTASLRGSNGNCAAWIAQAGISDIANANWLIQKESGCDPYIRNPSSGACGVAQELPCGKSGCSLGDGACQVKWMNGYVLARYGSWAGAVSFHKNNDWY